MRPSHARVLGILVLALLGLGLNFGYLAHATVVSAAAQVNGASAAVSAGQAGSTLDAVAPLPASLAAQTIDQSGARTCSSWDLWCMYCLRSPEVCSRGSTATPRVPQTSTLRLYQGAAVIYGVTIPGSNGCSSWDLWCIHCAQYPLATNCLAPRR